MEENDKLALHAIIINKIIPIEEAKEIAQEFIKDKKKHFYRETVKSYRFRNIPKTHFIPKCYKTKKINKNVSIIIGKLKPEHEHLEGSGLFDFIKKTGSNIKSAVSNTINKVGNIFKPRLDSYNNTSRKTIEQYGNLPINSLIICRTPILKVLDKALNFLSFNKFSELKKKYGFDELYHLQLVANVGNKNIVIEKNEVININTSFKNDSKTQTYQIPLKTMSGSGMRETYEADMARRKEAEPERLRLEQEDRKRRDAEYDARQAEWQQTDSYKYMQRKKEEAAAEKKLWDDAGKKTKKTGGANNQPLTINEILEKGREKVGDHLWFSYDAFKNNCQYFIKYCLEGVNLYDESAKNFLFQDIEELAKEMPQYVKTTANVLTTTGAVANKLMGKAKLKGGIKDGKFELSDTGGVPWNGKYKNLKEKQIFSSKLEKLKENHKGTFFYNYYLKDIDDGNGNMKYVTSPRAEAELYDRYNPQSLADGFKDAFNVVKMPLSFIPGVAPVLDVADGLINGSGKKIKEELCLCGGNRLSTFIISKIKPEHKLKMIKQVEKSFYKYIVKNTKPSKKGEYNLDKAFIEWEKVKGRDLIKDIIKNRKNKYNSDSDSSDSDSDSSNSDSDKLDSDDDLYINLEKIPIKYKKKK